MKAHLPKYLLTMLLTLGIAQGTSQAAMTEPEVPANNAWTWNGTEWIDDATGTSGTPETEHTSHSPLITIIGML